jgi:hypothetical protein
VREDVVLAAGDRQVGRGGQAREIVPLVAAERLFQPDHAEIVELAGGGEGAVVAPRRRLLGAGGAGFLRLVGVDHDVHPVADRGPHRLDLGDVLADRLAVQAQLDRGVAPIDQAQGVVGALLGRAHLDHAGVGADAVGVGAPEPIERQPGALAGEIPQRHLDRAGHRYRGPPAGAVDDRADDRLDV